MGLKTVMQSGSLLQRTLLHVLLGALGAALLTGALASAVLGLAGLADPPGGAVAEADEGEGAPSPKAGKAAKGAPGRDKKTAERGSGKDD